MKNNKVLVAYGDGIGPEIMSAVLDILKAAKADITTQVIEIGEKAYLAGHPTGIKPSDWDALLSSPIFLKAPITTPQGGGYKSLNVTIRKALGLYANIRPCKSYAPFIPTKHPGMNLVIVRENEEDLYAGIEYRQTFDVMQSIKLISRPGCEKIIRFAFEFAIKNQRKKVSCFSKDNIMKMSDGLFHKVYDEIGSEYPQIEKEHWIVDIGAARLADTPELFEVIVMENLYGDILSDVAAQIAGSVGMSGSANIGLHAAMFEAIHGSAPMIAGKNIANPSALLHGAIQMLIYMDQGEVAATIENAWLSTIEEGIHTPDVYLESLSKEKVGTKEFALAVIERLGKEPKKLNLVKFGIKKPHHISEQEPLINHVVMESKNLVGVDIYIDDNKNTTEWIVKKIQSQEQKITALDLEMECVSNRGLKVWPAESQLMTFTDHWRIRFFVKKQQKMTFQQVLKLLTIFHELDLDVVQVFNLYQFNKEKGYSLAQG